MLLCQSKIESYILIVINIKYYKLLSHKNIKILLFYKLNTLLISC